MTDDELLRRHKTVLKASNKLVIALQGLGVAASELYGEKLIAAISEGEEIEFRRVDECGIANDYDCILIEDILNKSKAQ